MERYTHLNFAQRSQIFVLKAKNVKLKKVNILLSKLKKQLFVREEESIL